MCVCACARRLGRLSPQILSILLYLEHLESWFLQTFGWPLVCVAVWHSPRRNSCKSRASLIPFLDPFIRGLSSAPVVCLCLLFMIGPGLIPLADHSQILSIRHVITFSLCLFYFLRFSFGWSFKVIDCFGFIYLFLYF